MIVSNIFKCNGCDAYICTSPDKVTDNGKHIPLNATGDKKHKPHNCPANPFVKRSYDFRQLPEDYAEKGKVRRCDRVYGPDTTYDTPEGEFSHRNRYEWQCTWCNEVYEYRIRAMKCCTDEEGDDW